jgi:2-keto-4-pentenoate hydratase/2-oxohepta-3-ene-1,7-dioic acid hydratase in catechol pathway
MRLCTFRDEAGTRLGEVLGDRVRPRDGRDVGDALGGALPSPAGPARPLAGLELLAPLRPGKVLGVGWNYPEHAAEMGGRTRDAPVVFSKLVTALTGPAAPVRRPSYTEELDYEGELAVVIGRTARDVPRARALEHVFGYAVMNDITARDRQRDEPQWVRAKGGDGFGPLGPWVTTRDEVPDPQALRIRTWVNGDLRQDASTAGMAFPVAALVEWCSAAVTLEPGDVIATGTPPGVGRARTSPAFLVPGDVVRVEIDGLGALENAIR